MSERLSHPREGVLENLDGFRVEVDTATERGDIVLDRPPLNVISMTQREQICAAIEALDADDRVRVIVIRSAGENLSSGGNIAGFLEMSPEHVSHLAWFVAAPERASKPVIMAVRGYCFGVGFELSLACDFRIASKTARFALPEMRIGMIPGSGGSARLLKMVGVARTKDMVMRARRVPGEEAHHWGICQEVVEDGELENAVAGLVDELRAFSPLAQRTIKHVTNSSQNATLSAAIEIEGLAYGRLRTSDDFREGVDAFQNKRKPRFQGK